MIWSKRVTYQINAGASSGNGVFASLIPDGPDIFVKRINYSVYVVDTVTGLLMTSPRSSLEITDRSSGQFISNPFQSNSYPGYINIGPDNAHGSKSLDIDEFMTQNGWDLVSYSNTTPLAGNNLQVEATVTIFYERINKYRQPRQ